MERKSDGGARDVDDLERSGGCEGLGGVLVDMSKINVSTATRLGQVMKAGRVGCEWLMAHRPARRDGQAKQGC